MTLGLPPEDERALLSALIAAAAPDAVPAEQAIPLLCRVDETDVAALAQLAYHALTGVEPGTPEPAAPADLDPGFPPFASEVLVRAIVGPDHRRPTPQALLVVLEMIGADQWPSHGRPHVVLAPPEPEPEPEAEPEPEPEPEVVAVVTKPAPEEFRSLLLPSRDVPRFDPLTDPLPDLRDDPVVVAPPVALVPEPEPEPAPVEPEPVEPEPEPVEPEPDPEPARHVDAQARPIQDEFRNIVAPTYAVPHFSPLEGAGPLPGLEDGRERRRRSGRKGRRRHPVNHTSPEDRRQTLVIVAVILVLVVLGAIYAASRSEDKPRDGAPQGASRTLDQPAPWRV
ncbi:hypothetical protein [Pimelobacter simplex]|uniref:hypothetical protein n=1 Tax=Nocardioides simplex TaxID=2045 RepID=UPI0021505E89|nr:hypothetical protein [Pimelobacter simplex]UUW91838.1 hypothetical protein M0M43_10245 [Pimelobacter simplex]UUW95666.1 hypothetical protein M0M48_28745 [Pimelobacter simplex]